MSTDTIPIALTIAGSDSGGGAGIQADLKTFHAFRVWGTSVVTAVTAQNTQGVSAVHVIPVQDVRAQLAAVALDLPPAAFKTGMLATAEVASTVAAEIARHGLTQYVLDPVMVATSGDRLLTEDAVAVLTRDLLPLAHVVTPNLREAEILTGVPVRNLDDMRVAADRIRQLGARAVLVKGGHLEDDDIVDLLVDSNGERTWTRKRIHTRHTHGTGCTLSAAITACLARGDDLEVAVGHATRFVAKAIDFAPGLGSGNGPISHYVVPD